MPNRSVLQSILLATSVASLVVPVGVAYAQTSAISVNPMPLSAALDEISRQSGTKIDYDPDAVRGKTSAPVVNATNVMAAVSAAIKGAGLSMVSGPEGVITVGHDIIVTARRDEAELSFKVDGAQSSNRSGKSLKELPQGTQVVTSALIRQQQSLNINDALRNSAGVVNSLGQVQGTPTFTIRGQPSTALQNGLSSGGGLASIDTVERIEILKGPAAILAGADNLGGVINVVDKRPSAEALLDLLVQYGTFDNKKVAIDASNALNESKTLSARIIGVQAGSERSFGDYRGRREQVIAPSLRYKTGTADYIVGLNATSRREGFENFRVLDPLDPTRFLDVPGRIGPRGQGFDTSSTRFYGSAEQRVAPWLTLVARGAYTREGLKGRYIQLAGFPNPASTNIVAFSSSLNSRSRTTALDTYARFNFRTGPIKHTVTAGYAYSKSNSMSFQQSSDPFFNNMIRFDILSDSSNLPLPGPAEVPSYRSVAAQNGYYIQDFVDIGRFHLLAAVRRTVVKTQGTNFAFGGSSRDRSSATSPNFGAVFDVSKAVSIYANYSKGFSPASVSLNCAGDVLPIPSSENIEGGAKADFFRGRLSVTASVFQLKENNLTNYDSTCPLPNRYELTGGIQTRGVELDANGEVLPGLNVSASYTFADNKFQDENFGTVPPALFRHKYSLYAVYELQKGGLEGLSIAGGIFGNGRSYIDRNGQISLPPQAQFDGNISYRFGKAQLNLGVKNITDRRLNAVSFNPVSVALLQPRTVTATLIYNFFK